MLADLTGGNDNFSPRAVESVLNTQVSVVFVELARRSSYSKVLETEQSNKKPVR